VDGSTAGPTDRQASRAWPRVVPLMGVAYLLAAFIVATRKLLQLACCKLKLAAATLNF